MLPHRIVGPAAHYSRRNMAGRALRLSILLVGTPEQDPPEGPGRAIEYYGNERINEP